MIRRFHDHLTNLPYEGTERSIESWQNRGHEIGLDTALNPDHCPNRDVTLYPICEDHVAIMSTLCSTKTILHISVFTVATSFSSHKKRKKKKENCEPRADHS